MIKKVFLKLLEFIGTPKRKIVVSLYLLAIVLVIGVFMFVRFNRNHIHDLPSILESGRLAVLTDSSRMGFSVKGDSVFGFQYEIIKAFADTLGLELVITEESDMAACMSDLKGGDYDIIASFIPVTSEWKNEALFTNPLFSSRQVLVQQITSDSTHKRLITSHFDLADDTIFVTKNSPYKMRLQNLSNEIASPIHVLEIDDKSSEQLVHLVALGKLKYTICDEQFAQKLKLQYSTIDVSIPIGFQQNHAWVVHKQSPKLQAELNDFLDNFIGSDAYWKIYRKYYN